MKQKVRIIDMVIDYGRPTAAKIVKKAVEDTIRQTRKEMYEKQYEVVIKDIIPNRLLAPLTCNRLIKKRKNGTSTMKFYGREILAMRRTMPAFDFYFKVEEVE